MSPRICFALGALLAMLAVAAGAFGAHALSARLTDDRIAVFEIAVRYQMYHALGLLVLGLAMARWPDAGFATAAWLLLGGTAIFAGTLYALTFGAPRWFGAITPLGGLLLIAGWIVTAWAAWRGAT